MPKSVAQHSQATQDEAAMAFVNHKQNIDKLLATLAESSENHFDLSPDSVTWGDVESLGHVERQLLEIVQFLNLQDA